MPEHERDFDLPWCQSLLKDPAWTPIDTLSRTIHPNSTENSLSADLLNNPRGIRAAQTLVKHDPEPTELSKPEVVILISLGDGVNGLDGICHGGIVALLLDEVFGSSAALMLGGQYKDSVTGGLSVSYKRPLRTPAVVLCRALVDGGVEGRKVRVKGRIEDGQGGIYATGDSVFVKLKPKI